MLCFVGCVSLHAGYEFNGGGWYGGIGFGGGIVVGASPSLGERSEVDPGWGATFARFTAVGPVGVEGSIPISGGSPGVAFSPGSGGGCYFMTSHSWGEEDSWQK